MRRHPLRDAEICAVISCGRRSHESESQSRVNWCTKKKEADQGLTPVGPQSGDDMDLIQTLRRYLVSVVFEEKLAGSAEPDTPSLHMCMKIKLWLVIVACSYRQPHSGFRGSLATSLLVLAYCLCRCFED